MTHKRHTHWTEEDLLEIYRWDQERRRLGTMKTKCLEYGITEHYMSHLVRLARDRFNHQRLDHAAGKRQEPSGDQP